jgi:ubiquinone/menaquinone biosynthesis C-methylase UbiE
LDVHPTATGFDSAAAAYTAGRPGYPGEAVALVVDRLGVTPGRRVLDLGAGTGKLTRELVDRGADVVAVEPMAGMRDELRRSIPGDRLEILEGTAEALPLDDASVDGATIAQAFHWFDGPAALAELHRVVRPDGWLAVVFNRRDLTTPVQAAIDDLLLPYRGDTPSWATHGWDQALETSDLFASDEPVVFPWIQHLTADGLVARVRSISFVSKLDAPTRDRVLARVRELHAPHRADGGEDPAEDTTVPLHYRTEVRLLQRRPRT